MNLKEYEGRALFEKYGVAVPRGVLVRGKNDTALQKFLSDHPAVRDFVVKAQLLSGKRGKRGGVVFATKENLGNTIEEVLKKRIGDEEVHEVMVEAKVEILREYYLGIAVDRFRKCPVLIFSRMGGIDIEEIAIEHPEKILEIFIEGDMGADFEKKFTDYLRRLKIDEEMVVDMAKKLWNLFIKEDATLVEINPLVIDVGGKVFAADAKVVIDDNALYRHQDLAAHFFQTQSALEKNASEADLSYVEMEGNLAVIGNGAGLVMATLDAVYDYGGKPANFCDIGGGATTAMMEKAMEIVLQKKSVRGIFINIFGGITHCDEIAEGLAHSMKKNNLSLPMVVRMVGTNEEKAAEILRIAGITSVRSFDEAAQRAASLLT